MITSNKTSALCAGDGPRGAGVGVGFLSLLIQIHIQIDRIIAAPPPMHNAHHVAQRETLSASMQFFTLGLYESQLGTFQNSWTIQALPIAIMSP